MPEARLQRTRELTPELVDGVTFFAPTTAAAGGFRGLVGFISFDWYRCRPCGREWRIRNDAVAPTHCPSCLAPLRAHETEWRAPHDNAADQLRREAARADRGRDVPIAGPGDGFDWKAL